MKHNDYLTAKILQSYKFGCIIAGLHALASCQESKPERFEREAKEYTERNCPQRASQDGSVILDSLVYHQERPNEIIYYYSMEANGDQAAMLQLNREQLYQQLLSNINSSVDLKNIKAAGLSIIYLYRDMKSKQEILKFTFTNNDYKPVL